MMCARHLNFWLNLLFLAIAFVSVVTMTVGLWQEVAGGNRCGLMSIEIGAGLACAASSAALWIRERG